MDNATVKLLGQATTIGELKALIDKYPDNTSFGFRNQPLQLLFEIQSGNEKFVVFDDVKYAECKKCGGKGWFEQNGELCDECVFGTVEDVE